MDGVQSMNIEHRMLKHWSLANNRALLNQLATYMSLVKHNIRISLPLSACSTIATVAIYMVFKMVGNLKPRVLEYN